MQPETRLAGLLGQPPARGFGRWLIWLASGYLSVGLATAALSGFANAVAPATGTVAAQLQNVHQHLLVSEVSFIASSLIALFAVPLMLALAFGPVARRGPGVCEHVAAAFFIMYAPLATIAYPSQYALLPRLLDSGPPQTAAIWYFGNHSSLPWFFDVLAYTFFAFGAVLLATRFLAEKTPLRWGSWFLLASSVGCLLTFIGQALGNAILIQGNLAGAALTIPFAIAAIAEGRDLMRAGPAPQAPGSGASLTSRLPGPSRREPRGAPRR